MEPNTPLEPVVLAASVRSLASAAHRVLKDLTPNPFETNSLTRRIEFLRTHLPARPSNELSRWLESLRVRVEARRESDPSMGPFATDPWNRPSVRFRKALGQTDGTPGRRGVSPNWTS